MELQYRETTDTHPTMDIRIIVAIRTRVVSRMEILGATAIRITKILVEDTRETITHNSKETPATETRVMGAANNKATTLDIPTMEMGMEPLYREMAILVPIMVMVIQLATAPKLQRLTALCAKPLVKIQTQFAP